MTAFWILIPTFHRNVLPPHSGCIIFRYRSSYLVSKPKRLTFENLLSWKIKNLSKGKKGCSVAKAPRVGTVCCEQSGQLPFILHFLLCISVLSDLHVHYIFHVSVSDINLHIRCCTCMLLMNKHIASYWCGVKTFHIYTVSLHFSK
jgi:hypothetical protein